MTAPLDVPESTTQTLAPVAGPGVVTGRSPWQIAWTRLKRDKVALGGGVVVILLVVVAVCAPLIVKLLGHPPLEFHYEKIDPDLQVPNGRFGGMDSEFLFGAEPVNGRDIFSRVVYGSRISLLIAFLATMLSALLGTVFGVIAGYSGGWVDTLISRTMDVFLAFPILLFAIALAGVVPDQAFGISGDTLRIVLIVFITAFVTWPYIGRIVRGQALALREREFVDAARSMGASTPRILLTEMLPNLFAPILVYTTLLIPTNILFEAALSFLGVGVRPPTPTWGGMLSDATHWYQIAPHFMLWPGLGDLRDRARVQPVRRRAARRPRPPVALTSK